MGGRTMLPTYGTYSRVEAFARGCPVSRRRMAPAVVVTRVLSCESRTQDPVTNIVHGDQSGFGGLRLASRGLWVAMFCLLGNAARMKHDAVMFVNVFVRKRSGPA
mmetsp:Transcript_30620/g.70551  ORF Transcript_30620/g.70551 Transcript_30620/m.70551 type:complete len:105 (+) Transcript_30620:240-554(+)